MTCPGGGYLSLQREFYYLAACLLKSLCNTMPLPEYDAVWNRWGKINQVDALKKS